jgi:hypothetical protein
MKMAKVLKPRTSQVASDGEGRRSQLQSTGLLRDVIDPLQFERYMKFLEMCEQNDFEMRKAELRLVDRGQILAMVVVLILAAIACYAIAAGAPVAALGAFGLGATGLVGVFVAARRTRDS